MAKMWTRVKHQYGRYLRVSRITASFIIFGLLYLIYKSLQTGQISGFERSRKEPIHHNPSNHELDAYLSSIYDTRPRACFDKKYDNQHPPSVSVIFTFHNNEFYDLKLTIDSFLKYTPNTAYSEVVILDDGTDIPDISKDVEQFLSSRTFTRLKVLRSQARDGDSASRLKASQTATGSILVFANCRVIFNEGWLEPLIDHVLYNPKTMAMPHVDNYLQGSKFFPLSNKLTNVFSLTLTTLHFESPEEVADDGTLMSPVMRGDIFAVMREYYDVLGKHDDVFKHGGGHDLELSLRTWLCGGEIAIIMCSRVAVHNALSPVAVLEPQNIRRLAELWLGSYKSITYKQRDDISPYMETSEEMQLRARRTLIQRHFNCKNFDWYLSNVALDLIIPTDDFMHFGKFRSNSGYCIKNSNGELKMALCQPMFYQPDMLFELSTKGLLMNAVQCIRAADRHLVLLTSCTSPTLNDMWSINLNTHQLENKAFDSMCLEHTPKGTSPLQLNDCSSTEQNQKWTVLKH